MHQAPKAANQLAVKARSKITLLLPSPTTTPTRTLKINSMAVRMAPITASPSHSSSTNLPSSSLPLAHLLPPPPQASSLVQLYNLVLTPTLLGCTSKEGMMTITGITPNNINTSIRLALVVPPLLEAQVQVSLVGRSMARCTEQALASTNTNTINININRVFKASWA